MCLTRAKWRGSWCWQRHRETEFKDYSTVLLQNAKRNTRRLLSPPGSFAPNSRRYEVLLSGLRTQHWLLDLNTQSSFPSIQDLKVRYRSLPSLRSPWQRLRYSGLSSLILSRLSPVTLVPGAASNWGLLQRQFAQHSLAWVAGRKSWGERFSLSTAAVACLAENSYRTFLGTQGERNKQACMLKAIEVIHGKDIKREHFPTRRGSAWGAW